MTKALVCAECFDIRALDPGGDWVKCSCGRCHARWQDPRAGKVIVYAKGHHQAAARIMGLNNRFFVQALAGFSHQEMVRKGGANEAWRALHDEATCAPGYLFDEKCRKCWVAIIQVGETGDVRWATSDDCPVAAGAALSGADAPVRAAVSCFCRGCPLCGGA